MVEWIGPLAASVITAIALLWQQHRTNLREDRIRREDREERAHDREALREEARDQRVRDLAERWRDERLGAHALMLERLNDELASLRSHVDAVTTASSSVIGVIKSRADDADMGEVLARVQLVGSVHSAESAQRAYTQVLLAQLALADTVRSSNDGTPEVHDVALNREVQLVFETINDYREAARVDLEVDL